MDALRFLSVSKEFSGNLWGDPALMFVDWVGSSCLTDCDLKVDPIYFADVHERDYDHNNIAFI